MSMFQRATKTQLKARVALDGPSGSGKTYTALTWASVFGSRIAVIDTERGSASLYSDRFTFDTLNVSPPYDPARLIGALHAAEKEGYEVAVIDSLSHFWEGEGGFLDIADAAGQRAQGNSWAGWKAATPQLRHLIDVMLGSDLHVIATMRSKTEWTQEEYTDSKGKTRSRPVRIGMAPVMRAGTEYEFTIVGDLDIEHRLSISKSRCEPLADLVVQPGRAGEAAEHLKTWLGSGEPPASRNDIDALKGAMDGIADPAARLACKTAFMDQFGNPEFLLGSRVDDARAFVAGYYEPAVPSAPTPPALVPQPEPAVFDDEPDDAPGPHEQPVTAAQAQQVHIAATKAGIDDTSLDVLIWAHTAGRSDSAKAMTFAEHAALLRRIAAKEWRPADWDQVAAGWAQWKESGVPFAEPEPEVVGS